MAVIFDGSETEWPKEELFVYVTWGKSPMIAFDSSDPIKVMAMNHAINKIGKELELRLFHQIGTSTFSENDPGFHGWETWAGKSASELSEVIPPIEVLAKEIIARW